MITFNRQLSSHERDQQVEKILQRVDTDSVQNTHSEGGRSVIPWREIPSHPYDHQGFWAKITGQGVLTGEGAIPGNTSSYEWVMVIRVKKINSNKGITLDWVSLDGDAQIQRVNSTLASSEGDPFAFIPVSDLPVAKQQELSSPLPFICGSQTSKTNIIICPAFEANGATGIPVGTIVWMVPSGELPMPSTESLGATDEERKTDKNGKPWRHGQNLSYMFGGVPTSGKVAMLLTDLDVNDGTNGFAPFAFANIGTYDIENGLYTVANTDITSETIIVVNCCGTSSIRQGCGWGGDWVDIRSLGVTKTITVGGVEKTLPLYDLVARRAQQVEYQATLAEALSYTPGNALGTITINGQEKSRQIYRRHLDAGQHIPIYQEITVRWEPSTGKWYAVSTACTKMAEIS